MLTDLNVAAKKFYDFLLSSNESFMFWLHSEAIDGAKVIVLENVTYGDSVLIDNRTFKSLTVTMLNVSFVLSDIDGSFPNIVIQNSKFDDSDHVGAAGPLITIAPANICFQEHLM